MNYKYEINSMVDYLKEKGASVVVIATEPMSDGYYRAQTIEDPAEDLYIEDLLNGLAKVTVALRSRLEELRTKG